MGSTAELNRGLCTGGASWVLLEGSNGHADGHQPDRVRVGFVEDSTKALNGLGHSEGGVFGINLFVLTDQFVGNL